MKVTVNSNNNKAEFQLSDEISVSSSLYYYAIDSNFRQGDETMEKCFENIHSIVDNWKRNITNSLIGEKFYAPFEYEDEYLGILLFELIDDSQIKISFFYTNELAGHSIHPSKSSIIDVSFEIPAFELKVIVQKNDFLNTEVIFQNG